MGSPRSELARVPWQDLDLPPGHPGSNEEIERILATKPAHWLGCWEGTYVNQEGGPAGFRPQNLTHDNIREVNAKVHVMNELIDEALGRVLDHIDSFGWSESTDVFFTTDQGEMQGDYGFLYKGPSPHGLADAAPDDLAAGTRGGHRTGGGRRSRGPARSRT